MNGLRDAQGGYGLTPAKKKKAPVLGDAGRDAQGGYAPVAPAVPQSIDTPGFLPDYASLIQNDPVLVQLRKDIQAQGAGDLAGRNASLNRLLVGFGGELPDLHAAAGSLGYDLSGAIDPTTAQLARENQFSTQARLADAKKIGDRQLRQQLAARGALQSGELGYQLDRSNKAYGQAQYDSNQQLLDTIAQLQQQFSAAERERQSQINAGLGDATNRQVSLNPATGSGKATYDPATGTYVDANGNHWNADGTPARATAASSAPPPQRSPLDDAFSGLAPSQSYFGAPTQYDAGFGNIDKILGIA